MARREITVKLTLSIDGVDFEELDARTGRTRDELWGEMFDDCIESLLESRWEDRFGDCGPSKSGEKGAGYEYQWPITPTLSIERVDEAANDG